jgi:hypothetical protein
MREAAESKSQTLIGKPIRIKDHYEAGEEVGIIDQVKVDEEGICFVGDIAAQAELPKYASYEISQAHVEDVRARVWRVMEIDEFLGVLLTDKPAYSGTRVRVEGRVER